MRRSIRKFVGVAAGGLGLSIALALIVTPLLAAASPNARQIDARLVGASAYAHGTIGVKYVAASLTRFATVRPLKTAATPSAACTAAKTNLAAAKTQDADEDARENAAGTEGTAADIDEDKAEWAARKPLVDAVISACGFGSPSAACTSAMQNLKNAIAEERAEDVKEAANGIEGTPADVTEDAQEKAALAPLLQAIKNACGFTTFFHHR